MPLDLIEDLSRGNSWLSFARGSSQIDYEHGEYRRAAGGASTGSAGAYTGSAGRSTGSAGVPPAGFARTGSDRDRPAVGDRERGSSPTVREGFLSHSSDRSNVRKDNTNYAGKTYNSVDSIAEFFKNRATQLGNTSGSFQSTREKAERDKANHGQGQRPKAKIQSPKHLDRSSETNSRNLKPETSGGTSSLPFTRPPVNRSPVSPSSVGPSSVAGPPSSSDFVPGSYVRHAKYGRGLVLRREGAGDSSKLTVTFPGYGQKKLIQKYAGLEKA
jgi:hypothetical protein